MRAWRGVFSGVLTALMGLVQDLPVGPVTTALCAAAVACVQCGLHLLNTFFDHRAEARRAVFFCFCRLFFRASARGKTQFPRRRWCWRRTSRKFFAAMLAGSEQLEAAGSGGIN